MRFVVLNVLAVKSQQDFCVIKVERLHVQFLSNRLFLNSYSVCLRHIVSLLWKLTDDTYLMQSILLARIRLWSFHFLNAARKA